MSTITLALSLTGSAIFELKYVTKILVTIRVALDTITPVIPGDDEESEEEGFSLVDRNGNEVSDGEIGLLLYNGGTVCDDGFNSYTADVLCRELGYVRALNWKNGFLFDMQEGLDIKLDNVLCRNKNWESCTYLTEDNCGHGEDVFLTCTEGTCTCNN